MAEPTEESAHASETQETQLIEGAAEANHVVLDNDQQQGDHTQPENAPESENREPTEERPTVQRQQINRTDSTERHNAGNGVVAQFLEELQIEERRPPRPNHQISAEILESSAEVARKLDNQDKSVDITLKILYGAGICIMLIIWICFVICFSNKQLEPSTDKIRHVSDPVFITLLTTATANIIALPTIILKYLFHRKD